MDAERERFDYLYAWAEVAHRVTDDTQVFADFEMHLYALGIRSRVHDDAGKKILSVPLKDSAVAKALYNKEVKSVYTFPKERYQIFKENLAYRNGKLYEDPYKDNIRRMRKSNLILLAVIFVVILILFKFKL